MINCQLTVQYKALTITFRTYEQSCRLCSFITKYEHNSTAREADRGSPAQARHVIHAILDTHGDGKKPGNAM